VVQQSGQAWRSDEFDLIWLDLLAALGSALCAAMGSVAAKSRPEVEAFVKFHALNPRALALVKPVCHQRLCHKNQA
jgi:hypothetical protein